MARREMAGESRTAVRRMALLSRLRYSASIFFRPSLVFVIIVWASVGFSAFIDNVPYITAMIPVVHIVAGELDISRYLLVFGLLIGSCLGGNIMPVGAAANIVAVGALKREGYHVSFWQFAKIGLPFTIAATLAGALVVWVIWR